MATLRSADATAPLSLEGYSVIVPGLGAGNACQMAIDLVLSTLAARAHPLVFGGVLHSRSLRSLAGSDATGAGARATTGTEVFLDASMKVALVVQRAHAESGFEENWARDLVAWVAAVKARNLVIVSGADASVRSDADLHVSGLMWALHTSVAAAALVPARCWDVTGVECVTHTASGEDASLAETATAVASTAADVSEHLGRQLAAHADASLVSAGVGIATGDAIDVGAVPADSHGIASAETHRRTRTRETTIAALGTTSIFGSSSSSSSSSSSAGGAAGGVEAGAATDVVTVPATPTAEAQALTRRWFGNVNLCGYSHRLFRRAASAGVPATVVLRFLHEGDNVPDAIALARVVAELGGWSEELVKGGSWVPPAAWAALEGTPADPSILT